jgi:hypothetical protein
MAKGYIGIGVERGKYVEKSDGYEYALKACGIKQNGPVNKEFSEMLEEWFFSGNWIECETEE